MSLPTFAPLGILGFGHFGRALASLARRADIPFLALDPAPSQPIPAAHAADSLDDLARRARTLFLCIPVESLAPVLERLRPLLTPDHFVLDVGSVKLAPAADFARILSRDIPWCATHPLFGPAALARDERPLRAVVCPGDLHPDAHTRAAAVYHALGCQTLAQSPEDHDRLMARTHAMAFFIAKALLDLHAPESDPFVPPSFRAIAQTIDTVRADAGHLFNIIQQHNPYAPQARRALIETLTRIDRDLSST